MQEINSFKEYINEKKSEKGTYIGWRYNRDTIRDISQWMIDNNIPNPIKKEKIHSTIIYSRKEIDIEPKGKLVASEYALSNRLGTFDTQDNKRALIWFIDCPAMVNRHNYIMKTTDATYDYVDYIPHITLSYEIPAEYDVDKLTTKGLPLALQIVSEYKEDLNLDWV